MSTKKPVMLIILDGWGLRTKDHGNAVVQGDTPNYDRWSKTLERAVVDASGEAVGLVPDQMGNSEVGHLNLGAGRIVYQDISRIDIAIRDGSLASRPALADAFAKAKERGSAVHLVGLMGSGGVHSHESHLFALIDSCAEQAINPVIHVITDGRDTPPNSGIGFLHGLQSRIEAAGVGQIATVSGRYYAMDRDRRWERTKKSYDAMVHRQGDRVASAEEAILNAYEAGVTDEFIPPVVVGEDDENLRVKPGDVVIFYNFRADRMRQIVAGFAVKGHDGFAEEDYIDGLTLVTFTEYAEDLPVGVVFPIELLQNTLAETLSKHGLKQYHSAETEKYPHVTFFFNGRREEPFPGEDRAIIASPKVATYDLQPEMSAYELTETTLKRLQTHDDDFLLINFANPDMVGHTGSLEAARKAVSVVDECAGRLVAAVNAKGGVALVTADHGNCERMVEEATGDPHTYHTTNPVSLFAIGEGYIRLRPRGILADVAPTVLDILGVPKPVDMTGRSLIEVSVPEELGEGY